MKFSFTEQSNLFFYSNKTNNKYLFFLLRLNIQALPASLLVKFEKGMQSKISNGACIHTREKNLGGLIVASSIVRALEVEITC